MQGKAGFNMEKSNEKWYDEGVFYHIYPLGMTGAPKTNEGNEVVHRFDDIEKWIPHLSDLGITAIYIGPLFESTSHGYDTKDYRKVDKRLGDNKDFAHFVKVAHKRNIKVVVDGVFNHTGREFFAFQDILKNRQNSQYCSWYKGVSFDWSSPYNDGVGYEAWRNCYELVNLNPWEPAVREYLLDTIDYWIDEFEIDGIRLDCADCLADFFVEEMRARTDAKKKDFWLMGEVIHGDYGSYISDKKLHSVTDYQLHKGLYSGHNDHNYFEIAHTVRYLFGSGGQCEGTHLYSFVDNHDVDRLASKINISGHMKPIYTLLYTLPGIPSIYYGSEWGIEGKKEGANDDGMRPCLDIEHMLKPENQPAPWLTDWIKVLGKVHALNAACLAYGVYDELVLTNRQFAYGRWIDEEGVITAVNNDEQPAEMWIPVRIPSGVAASSLPLDVITDAVTGEHVNNENGQIHITIQSNESRIFVVGKRKFIGMLENEKCGSADDSCQCSDENTENPQSALDYGEHHYDSHMRRSDREVGNLAEIQKILEGCKVCHMAMVDDGMPYVIPLSYGYELEGDRLTVYVHCAREGRKIDVLRKNSSICFELCVEGEIEYERETPCNSGCYYSSIIGFGNAEFVENPDEKCKALSLLMKSQVDKEITFTEKQADTVCVLKVVTTNYSAKIKPRRQ